MFIDCTLDVQNCSMCNAVYIHHSVGSYIYGQTYCVNTIVYVIVWLYNSSQYVIYLGVCKALLVMLYLPEYAGTP